MASREFVKRITHSILNKSPQVSSYICAMLWELGEATSQSFFSPKYSFTKPTRDLFGLGDTKFRNRHNKNKESIRQSLRRLNRQGIVKKRGANFMLTKQGREMIEKIISRERILKKKWDKKYRLVIFDIPEKKRGARNWLRSELYMIEYSQLQMSVFIGKHPLPEDIIKDIEHHGIGKYVNYLLVKNVYDKKRINKKK
jgi:RNA-binding protein YhbY